MESGYP